MYLKRLDLQGFKSFPDKVKLEFNKGITTVVGPNGSGKSNISDSVRWVLGEQRAKSLRGDKMEDVIFVGTSNRKALGFAEVSITLDNLDKKIPLDYSEITVTRTVYRSGESRYLINGTVCRLKDVHELFMDTGVGKEGYSIIGQGRIDEILSSKSEDRRRLFEEAAGIVKYRSRRFEAINKLQKEHENLIRVEDIINELEIKVEPLFNQSETAKQFLTLKEQLKRYEISNFYIQAGSLEKNITEIIEAKTLSSKNIEDEKENYQISKKETETLKEKEEKFLSELEKLNNDIATLLTEEEKSEGEINLFNEQIQHIEQNVKRIDEEKNIKTLKIDELSNEEGIFNARLVAIGINISSLNSDLKNAENEFNNLSGMLEKNEEQVANYKTETIEKIKTSTDIKSNIVRLEMMCNQFTQRQSQVATEKDYNESRINDESTRVEALNKTILNAETSKDEYLNSLEVFENEKQKIAEEINKKNALYQQKNLSLNENKSKFKVLSEMKNDYEGFFKSVKAILKLRGTNGFTGVCGALGELINVDKQYEAAIEIAVGGALQNIVTENEQDGKTAIDYLKRNNLGRATFLPISVIKGRDLGNDKSFVLGLKGVVGIASDLVAFDKKYQNVVTSILGRVIIAENMDFALNIAKTTKHQYKIVTTDGDVINPGGTMTGGSIAKKTSNIFSRSREIDELKAEIDKTTKENDDILLKIEEETNKLKELDNKIVLKTEAMQQLSISIATYNQELIQCKDSIEEKRDLQTKFDLEYNSLEKQIISAKSDISEINQHLAVVEKEAEEINRALEEYQGAMQSDKSVRDEILNRITNLKVSISSVMQEKKSVDDNLSRVLRERNNINDEIKKALNEKEEYFSNKALKEKEIKAVTQKIADYKNRQTSFEKFKLQISENISNVRLKIHENEEKKQTSFETINKLENHVFKLETKLERLEEERSRVYNSIWEEYEITYQQAKEQFDESISFTEISSVTKDLKNQIKNLGNINVNAIEEYKEVKERFDFLSAQRDDIVNAEEKLQKIIDELAGLMEDQFKEQFKLISENFNLVFREMFGGGKAYLKLVDESNVLESGIDIIAQPPGKNLQNMMLLSGGERALTAIAILFSILKMKPSPFCILDEIEAALDDANVKRFADYLRDFSFGTQFIIITHRKGTMESADVMYGVTMQEQGVSKVISVKFDDEKGA